MPASSLSFLRQGPPPPRVVLLPDGLFFIRAVPVGPQEDPLEVARQVELALESEAPFPLAQLYYGHYWVPGSPRALAFATYRRRLTPEQTAEWAGAGLVIPAFAAVLGGPVEPATTVILGTAEGLTAIHWPDGPVPSQARFHPLAPDATEEDRARARDELLRRHESRKILDLAGPPQAEPDRSDREILFRCGDFVSKIPAGTAEALDIRDREELRLLRKERGRRRNAWRVLMVAALAACLLLAGEIALIAGGLWEQTRQIRMHAQAPLVDQIMTAQSLTHHIEVLSTKQLLPMEMIGAIVGKNLERKPESIQFLRASCASGQPVLTVEAQTSNPGDINVYRQTLSALPVCARVDVKNVRTANNQATFTLVVTFKPGALKPGGGSQS